MAPDRSESRFEEVSRRAFLKRSALLGAAVLVPGALITACGGSDESVFGSTTTTGATATTLAATTTSTSQQTTTTTSVATNSGDSVPASAQMAIDFAYQVTSSQGPAHNPYVAVWIEDQDGELVTTIALWLLQSQKGLRWVNELRRWDSVDGSSETIDTVSSATRTPGDYSLLWDVTDSDGAKVAAGDYFVCIEAAREHGPYSLIREQVTLGTEPLDLTLGGDGELADATVTYAV